MFRFTRPHGIQKARKSAAAKAALKALDDFLNAACAGPVYFLTHLWQDQCQAITYKELREAVLHGGLDEKTLQAWEQDYAKLVTAKLEPVWKDAMKAANDGLMKQFPEYYFDPAAQGVQGWITQRGAQWVTVIGGEQRKAIAAMLSHGAAGGFGVDELSRAIRPCVGLNQPQVIANLRYYQHVKQSLLKNNPGMKPATAIKRAQEAAVKYAERQHRGRAYLIAKTELAFAYNKGAHEGIRQCQEQGFLGKMVKVWSTAGADACPVCAALEGASIGMDEDFHFGGKLLYAEARQTPPAHPGCRCAVAYEEVEPPQFSPATPEALEDWQAPAPEPPDPPAPQVPPSLQVPPGMRHHGKASLGGTGEIHLYTDKGGQEWLFKPAQSKSGVTEPFRAYAQEAAYKVQYIVEPETAVPVGVGELDGRFGAFQMKIETLPEGLDLKVWQASGGGISREAVTQLQREHVTDWLVGNFDSHGGNFITDKAGRLIGIDKEQAFKHISQESAQAMSIAYHPNAAFGETEPVYNTLFRRFMNREVDLNLQDSLAFVKRVEAVPDAAYRDIFKGYAVALVGAGKAADDLLDKIVERKQNLRETYRAFYSDLLTVRTGKKQAFIFADEAPEHKELPIAAVMFTPEVLSRMTTAELKQLANQKQIPYSHTMKKAELVAAISDPVKAAQIVEQIRARVKAKASEKKKPAKAKTACPAGDLFKDFSIIPDTRYGVAVHSDKGSVEGLNLTARRMNIGGTEYYELSGKLSESVWSRTWELMKKDSDIIPLEFEVADQQKKLYSPDDTVSIGLPLKCRKRSDGQASFELYVNGSHAYRGWQGFFRLRVPASDNHAAANAKALLGQLQLGDLADTPTAGDEQRLIKSRLIWQHAPGRVKELSGLTGAALDDKIKEILKEENLTNRVSRLKLKKVFDGYSTYVDEGSLAEYQKAGLQYLWCGVSSAESIVAILKGGGLTSTNQRMQTGISPNGASPDADISSGGSDSVFTRIGVDTKGHIKYQDCYGGSGYRILLDPVELERSDWYAYTSDKYGRTYEPDMLSRLPALDFIKSMQSHYKTGNELMFRKGVPASHFIGITCDTAVQKATLLELLKNADITQINGIDIDKFVEIRSAI